MATLSTLPNLAPPRIGICGGSSIDDVTAAFCQALGRALARRQDAVLVTGGCRRRVGSTNLSVDWHTVQGAMSILKGADEVNARIETLLPEDDPKDIEKFGEGHTITLRGASPQGRRFRLLASVDVLVAVEGGPGTRQHLDLALAIDRPLLPLAFFGGESAKYWNGADKADIVRSMGLSAEDVRFLDEGIGDETRQNALNAVAERVAALLWKRLTKVCMVMMPFAAGYDPLYNDVLKPAIERAGLFPLRTDRLNVPIDIVDTINRGIESCQCAIAVLDGSRPNVFYELGRAHAYDKPVLILLREGEKPPFDIAGLSYLPYTAQDASLAARIEGQLNSITAKTTRRLTFTE